ncbi:MAG: M20/M25/M40 family metallo-hydrolase [Nitrosopumilaceae archaeon]
MNQNLRHVDQHMKGLVSDLRLLIRQPSVSAKKEGLEECAKLVRKIMKKSGIKSELLLLKKGVPPVVYGEVKSKQNPDRTLLFYNHYDVQPVEPLDLWNDKPFSGKVQGNKIFGRGSSDDKGELITRIKAVESFLSTKGDVPCNIKFVVEGEEEIGSEHIESYLKKYRKKLECDGVIWEFGYVDSKKRPIISLGMKGLLYIELSKKESVRDVHSSLAVIIKNPAWRLVEAIKSLRNADGKILVKDWYKDVKPLTRKELKLIQSEPFDEAGLKKEYGIKNFVANKKGKLAKKALVAEPTCNIAGFVSGYTEQGAKTVLPGNALVKIDFRLVPNMEPKQQLARLRRHLKSKGFGDLKMTVFHGEAPSRTDISDPFVRQVKEAADKTYGKSILSLSSAGTGPMYAFAQVLKVPCVSIGCTYIYSRIHSPNEFARLDLIKKTTKCMCLILEKFGKT